MKNRRSEDQAETSVKKIKLHRGVSLIMSGSGKPHNLGRGAKVRLRPLITLDKDDRIDQVAVCGRTPSPFGKAMGDHTVAWQAVVDEVHALLYGKSLAEATKSLKDAHEDASAWMKSRGTLGKQLLRYLEDNTPRWNRLEDATFHATEHLGKAEVAMDKTTGRRELALALAYHLAYLNYLPFGTVPARSARGSHGSAEGRHRGVLVAYEQDRRAAAEQAKQAKQAERARLEAEAARAPLPSGPERMQTDEDDVREREAARVRAEAERARAAEEERVELERIAAVSQPLLNAQWALFDFAGAFRAADLEYVLRPSAATTAAATAQKIADLAADLKALAKTLEARGSAVFLEVQTKLEHIEQDADTLAQTPGTFEAFARAARAIRDCSRALSRAAGESDRALKSTAKKTPVNKALTGGLDATADEAAYIQAAAKAAPDRAARVLGTLLRRHMTALAAAYPSSVTDGGLLGDDHAASAYAQLYRKLLASEYSPDLAATTAALAKLKKDFTAAFGEEVVEVADSNAWVADADSSALVVVWDSRTQTMTVNGRAAAPEGVAGMGSHTTAWKLEVQSLNAIIDGALDDATRRTRLRVAVQEDLVGDVIQLDKFLPADQLEGNQLIDLFEAAASIVNTEEAEEAARCSLEFRNMLPFATVDEGDRAGHGEGSSGITLMGMYDKKALHAAADGVAQAMKDEDQVERISLALDSAAGRLKDEMKDTDNTWPEVVRKAARASAARLIKQSTSLGEQLDDDELDEEAADGAAIRIKDTRWDEHQRVWELVYPS